MRILHIYKDYFPVLGGIENYMKVLAEAQAAAGHKVAAAVCHPGMVTRIEELNGVKVIKSRRWATVASMPLSISHPLVIARLKPDVVHVHSPYPLGEVSAWAFKARVPMVITHHSDVVRQQGWLRLYAPLLRRVLKRADRIIATSPRYIETSPWLAPVAGKCTVIPLGVDHRRFTPPSNPFAGPLTALFVGRLRYYKGVDTLLHALVDVPEMSLNIVGTGPLQDEWKALAHSLGLAARVHFLGEIPDEDLPAQYHAAHLFVLPANARAEAFGTVLLEAMASGLPCISTEVGSGTSWVVQDGVTGRVVPPQDPAALAKALRELIDEPEKRRAMGQAGRQRVETEFTQELMTQRVMKVYESLV